MAFPGSMVGALCCGLVYHFSKRISLTCVAEALGTGVLGGIITATLLAIFLVPLFFRLTAGKRGPDHPEGI